MSRSLTAAAEAAVTAGAFRAELLAEFEFDSGDVRFWSGIGPLVWDGDTYTGAGNLGAVSQVEESAEVKATGLTFSLSGIPSELLSVALGEHYQGRPCSLWLGFFDSDWALIDDPVPLFSGRMDVMVIADEGETCTITVTAENRLVDLDRANETRYYTDQDQQSQYPGDRGLEYVPALQEAVIVWGTVRVIPSTGGSSGSGAAPTTGASFGGGDFGDAGGDGGGGAGGEGSGAGGDASGADAAA